MQTYRYIQWKQGKWCFPSAVWAHIIFPFHTTQQVVFSYPRIIVCLLLHSNGDVTFDTNGIHANYEYCNE